MRPAEGQSACQLQLPLAQLPFVQLPLAQLLLAQLPLAQLLLALPRLALLLLALPPLAASAAATCCSNTSADFSPNCRHVATTKLQQFPPVPR
eukprot:CAMPEP_0174734122 /NCGR_PEP_ID=MMETSP1094-20130205/62652_1 /TAXON_ID=156173 /ORGANISM="Chrysochromulina brevifilum, Strain UTEX LB 985" /LENGTH=92 /DNA_ID=CAMNT_0015936885 /DNA_START=60 /DNA_END=334 /DNA_ORIENTATION=-